MTTTATHTFVGPLTASGTSQLPFDFQAISEDEVGVIKDGVELITGYAVFTNPDGTGYITPNTSWGASQVIIFSRPFFTQETDFDRFEPFYPDGLNHPFDVLGRQILALRNVAIGVGDHGDIIVTDEDHWEIAPGAVGAAEIADGSVGSAEIADGSVTPIELDRAYLPLTGGILSGSLTVPTLAYGPSWNGSNVVPTRDAVYDKIESLALGGGGAVDDTAYGVSWDGVTTTAPSKNAVFDKIEALAIGGGGVATFNGRSGTVTLTSADVTTALAFTPVNPTALAAYLPLTGGILSGALTVPTEAYGVSWNGSNAVPTKDAIYDKIESMGGGGSVDDTAYAASWDGVTAIAPSKNAVYDKIQSVIASIPAAPSTVISNVAYTGSWDGDTTVAPSKNVVYDKIETLQPKAPTLSTSTSSSTLTPVGTEDGTTRTTQTVNLSIAAPTGTPVNLFGHVIRIKATSAIATVSWNAIYRAIGVTLPTSLVNGKTTYIGIIYNSADAKWDVVSVATEA